MNQRSLLAVDVGNSKTRVALLGADGLPWITVVGPGSGWDIDISSSIERIDRLYRNALDKAELPTGIAKRALRPDLGVFALAGADLPEQEKQTQIAIEKQQWTTSTLVINDTFAILRAGSQRNWGIAVACGAGINCAGKFPNGTLLRFPALGVISGDWGGGYDVGLAALGAASRSEDSRGAPTALARVIARHFNESSAIAVAAAIHMNRIDRSRLLELSPVVFGLATEGDDVACAIVDRLADEVVSFVRAALTRLDAESVGPEVVLGGALLQANMPRLMRRIAEGILSLSPNSPIIVLEDDPIVGVALIALDYVNSPPSAGALYRSRYSELAALDNKKQNHVAEH
jgi:N-acetylglucosamine kinase-like BadF-type ATPase